MQAAGDENIRVGWGANWCSRACNLTRVVTTLNATSQRLKSITTELQEGVRKTRIQPIGNVRNKLPRVVVRDVAFSLGKQIRLKMDGTGTELERTIIEAIRDP